MSIVNVTLKADATQVTFSEIYIEFVDKYLCKKCHFGLPQVMASCYLRPVSNTYPSQSGQLINQYFAPTEHGTTTTLNHITCRVFPIRKFLANLAASS